jgi:hypothetical protein
MASCGGTARWLTVPHAALTHSQVMLIEIAFPTSSVNVAQAAVAAVVARVDGCFLCVHTHEELSFAQYLLLPTTADTFLVATLTAPASLDRRIHPTLALWIRCIYTKRNVHKACCCGRRRARASRAS